MMKMLAMLALVAVVAGTSVPADRRLIRLGEDMAPVWMTGAEVDALSARKERGFVDVTDLRTDVPMWVPRVAIPTAPAFPAEVANVVAELDADNWWANVEHLMNYGTRHRNTAGGVEAAIWILDTMREYGSGSSLNISYHFVQHNNIDQDSTVTTIAGCDPAVASEVIVIGGHEDSTSFNVNDAPGADDDATGTALVMEVFRAVVDAGFCPRRTVEFHTYAGEEGGLIGSNAIAQDYASRGVNVVSMLQFDMTSYANYGKLGIIRDFTSDALNNFVIALLDEYVPDLPYEDSTCGYGCSDHAAWNSRGYPASFPFEAPFGRHNPSIHTPNDNMAQITKAYGALSLDLGAAYVVEMSLF